MNGEAWVGLVAMVLSILGALCTLIWTVATRATRIVDRLDTLNDTTLDLRQRDHAKTNTLQVYGLRLDDHDERIGKLEGGR